jgi:peptidoglycan/xylan/chitin deacetylase (PgdA/CDA1 family)
MCAFILIALTTLACNNASETTAAKKDSIVTPKKEVAVVPKDTVSHQFDRKPVVYDSTKKYIYLTFDDGPHAATISCFETCNQLGIKSTFFMVGRHASGKWGKDEVKKIKYSYPQSLLANHSYSHANEKYKFFYEHPAMAEADFYKAQDSMAVPYKIIRLPGNSAWVRKSELKSSHLVSAVCKRLDSAGYNVIGWDVEWNFARKTSYPVQSAEKMASEVMYALNEHHTHVPNHVMILTHDRMFRTPAYRDSLAKFIAILKRNPNYVFETVDNYPGLKF